MAARTVTNVVPDNDDDLSNAYFFHQLDAYDWSDPEFQGGLRAILGSVDDPAQIERLTIRAKCYYFARKSGLPVDFEGYRQWVESQHAEGSVVTNGAANDVAVNVSETLQEPHSGGDDGGMANAPKPASFAEICELIAEGKPIPGIKEIPDTVLEGQASQSQAQRRKKPWERESAAASGIENNGNLSWMN